MPDAQPGQEQRMEIEALTDAEAESAFFTLIGMFDKLGCAPGGTVEKKEGAGVSFRLHFNVERVRRLLAVTRPTADLGDDGELDAALLRARTNIQMGGNTLRIDSTDLQLFVRVLSRSGADNTRVKDQSHGG